ncbi:MAG: beta-ketoacyl synthase N-terminal-like domain-containing protein [Polyangiales bacterium]
MRLALTGFGMVCAVGRSVAEAWPKIVAGERGIGPVTLFDVSGQKANIAAEVKELEVPHEAGPLWSRTDAMALSAAREAMREAKLDPRSARVGLIVGGTTGGMFETEELLARMHKDPALRTPNPEMLAHPLSATVDRVGKALGPFNRARTVCSACSSGANAFALAATWLEMGLCDAVVVGGTDGLCRLTFTGFNALGAIDLEPARPFDRSRRGLTIGEGAGFAVLENGEHAERRGAHWDVELGGFGITSDAHHITNPAEDGTQAARAISLALVRAGLSPSQVGYVNAHGTATPLNDPMEARALEQSGVAHAWVSSTKGVMGHTLGAAGAIEAVITSLAIREKVLPPTAGLVEVDPRCAHLRHVPSEGVRETVDVAISNSFGFGGVDTVLALARRGTLAERQNEGRAVYVSGVGTTSGAGALAGEANLALLGPRGDAQPDPTSGLDPARARRLDRAARLGTAAAQLAGARDGDGVIYGSSYGDADGSASFLAKLFAKGPRLVPPADFPNLVPSSPTGHVSIYLGLHGPAIAVADLSTSGEAGVATAFELIASHAADAIVAGSVEGPSEIAASCIAPAFRALVGEPPKTDRTEGAAALRLTSEPSAIRVAQVVCGPDVRALLAQIAPSTKPTVVVAESTGNVRAALADSAFAALPVRDVAAAVGRHEGLGGFALAAGAALLLAGQSESTMIVGASPGRSYVIVLTRA